ncbi:hypothetical protein Bca52824_018860 [Brassica carinata]|uniref:DUF4094 domain-containing protein n=1 Tax=Brassica carinata TaxID=52824 RepID=A0A8X7VPN9_BRACI|nr:hypothetical protein Bca52824_018860 [Brassica carinata]
MIHKIVSSNFAILRESSNTFVGELTESLSLTDLQSGETSDSTVSIGDPEWRDVDMEDMVRRVVDSKVVNHVVISDIVEINILAISSGLILMWNIPESNEMARPSVTEAARLKLISEGCGPKTLYQKEVKLDPQALFGEVSKTHNAIQTLDKTISSLEMELAAARSAQESLTNGAAVSNDGLILLLVAEREEILFDRLGCLKVPNNTF